MTTFRAILVCTILLGACGAPESECPEGTMRVRGACALVSSPSPDGGVGTEPGSDAAVPEPADAAAGDAAAADDDASITGGDHDACAPAIFWADTDGDGHGDPAITFTACVAPAGWVAIGDDCDDECPTCFPGAPEACDGADQDCDATLDEGLAELTSYTDADADGHGDPESATTGCAIPAGRVAVGGDCDDGDATRHPGALEICNDADEDCDTLVDEGVRTTWYRDCDRDGYAPGTSGSYQACTAAASAPSGCTGGAWTSRAPAAGTTDCHDFDPSAFPTNATWYSTPTAGGFSGVVPFDHDCDGLETRRDTAVAPFVPCAVIAGSCRSTPGWSGSVPACGATGTYVSCGTGCSPVSSARPQQCR
jgi:hypothetical protein